MYMNKNYIFITRSVISFRTRKCLIDAKIYF